MKTESTDIKMARYEVQANRERLESAFGDLEDKIRLQTRKVENLRYQVKAPERFVKRNPFLTAGLLASVGFLIGTRLHKTYGAPSRRSLERYPLLTESERMAVETDYLRVPAFERRSGLI